MALPADVRRFFGFALSLAQAGEKCDAVKVLKGIAKMKSRLIDNVEVFRASDNVFADLGLVDAEKLKIKSSS
jgi:phage-related protein